MAAPGQAEQLATLLDLGRELALETDVDVVLRRESARLIGARLVIDSSPGQGTRVCLRVPTEGRTVG